MEGREHTSRLTLLGAVGLLAAAVGLVRLATHDEADRSQPGALPPLRASLRRRRSLRSV